MCCASHSASFTLSLWSRWAWSSASSVTVTTAGSAYRSDERTGRTWSGAARPWAPAGGGLLGKAGRGGLGLQAVVATPGVSLRPTRLVIRLHARAAWHRPRCSGAWLPVGSEREVVGAAPVGVAAGLARPGGRDHIQLGILVPGGVDDLRAVR